MEYTFNLSTLVSIFTLVCSGIGFLWLSASRIARLEVKVDTIWDYIIKKAMTDALSKGVATQNSPITVPEEVRKWVAASIDNDLYRALRELYKEHKKLSDNNLALKIQEKLGAQIAKEMCIPNDNLNYDSCLFIALELAKNGTTKDEEE